jgi:hypothetical protein
VPRKRSNRLAWGLVGLLVLLLLGGAAAWWMRSRRPQATMYFNAALPFAANDLDLSPGGRTVALVAYSDQVNKYMIWTYDVPMSIILNWTSKMER